MICSMMVLMQIAKAAAAKTPYLALSIVSKLFYLLSHISPCISSNMYTMMV